MSLIVALGIGVALGLASFGGLWLSVCHMIEKPRRGGWFALSQLGRLAACTLVFCAVSRGGIGPTLSALGGLWIARWHLIRRLEVARNGR